MHQRSSKRLLGWQGYGVALAAFFVIPISCGDEALRALPTTPVQPPPPVGDATTLTVAQAVPPGVFGGQQFDITIQVVNTGTARATNVVLSDRFPEEGSQVSVSLPGTTSAGIMRIPLGSLDAGATMTVVLTWLAPNVDTVLFNQVMAGADNGRSDVNEVSIGVGIRATGDGDVIAAGTSLRNRSGGNITIAGLPAQATVTRAVLVWAILYSTSTPPPGTLTLDGTQVTADLTAIASGELCWGDTETIGYASDVTSIVQAKQNGVYRVGGAINGSTGNTLGAGDGFLPYTDGASLFVFFTYPGMPNRQVKSDFGYGTNTRAAVSVLFSDITSAGGSARLILAGPDGQDASEEIDITGSGMMTETTLFEGSDPIDGTPLSIGNLWDTDTLDISQLLPAGQTTLQVDVPMNVDCVGISAAVLVVDTP